MDNKVLFFKGQNILTNTTTLFGSLSGTLKWVGGVLAPNGKIYCVPYSSTQVLEIDPVTNTTTLSGSLSGTVKWIGGVLAPNGKIYCVPLDSTQVLEISNVNVPNIMGIDAVLPIDLSTLATSIYNKYYNKF